MRVLEISECFPNKFKPVTGEFILQHGRALSKHCKVIILVPLRYVPSKELFSPNPAKLFSNLKEWFSKLNDTKNISEANLNIIYFPYFSLPRPVFEAADRRMIIFFFYDKLKKLVSELNPDIIYCNWLRPWAEPAARLASELDIPLIIDHHEDLPTLKNLFPKSNNTFIKTFEKADGIVVHSTVNKNDLLNENLNLPEPEIIYLGQNFPVTEELKDFNFNKLKLICVSHLNEPRKNVDDLIRAAAVLRSKLDFELTIAGDGMLKENYENLSRSLDLSRDVHFTGMKTQKEIEALLDESHLFVLPSNPEAFGIVFIEALAKGLPVITCEGNGGGEELKRLGYPVVSVKPNSPGELSKAILDLSSNKDEMRRMSEIGKRIVKENFTWDRNASLTYKFLEDTIKEYSSKS